MSLGAASDHAVIDVNGEDGNIIAVVGGKNAWIGFVDMKAKVS